MSYTSGLDNLQQLFGNTGAASISQTDSTNKAGVNETKASPYSSAKVEDAATVSTASAQLSSALAVSDVRAERVTALQQQIQGGSYQVPSSAVAEKLVTALLK